MYQSIVLIYAMQLLSMSFIYVGPSVVKMLSGPVVSGKNNYWGTASTSALWCTAEEIVVSLGPIPVCLFRKKIPYRQSYACEFDSFTVYSNQKLPWSVQCGRKAIWFTWSQDAIGTSDIACCSLLTISSYSIRNCSCFSQGHWVCAHTSWTVECPAGLLLLQTFWFQVVQYSRVSKQHFQ